jgi:Icc-related predicted phosphoesterase
MRACRYDLVAFTGDIFAARVDSAEDLELELLWLKVITAKLGMRTRLALGTGVGDEEVLANPDLNPLYQTDWRTLVPEVAVRDGMNQVVAGQKGRVLVSVFGSRFRFGEDKCARLKQWLDAQRIVQMYKMPWIVLHPQGPYGTAITQSFDPHNGEYNWDGCTELVGEIEKYQPDFFVGGYPHHTPFEGGHWCDKIGRTLILNPGCRPVGEYPCHIEIDIERNRARWRVSGIEESVVSLREESTSSENAQPSQQ